MPIARVQGPDGKIYRFEVPEGASEQEIQDFAQSTFGKSQEPTEEKDSRLKDFGQGVASSALSSYYGLKDLVAEGGATEDERELVQKYRDESSESGWGTAGRMVGELGQLALPGAGAARLTRALTASAGPRVARGAQIAGEAGVLGAHGAAQLPGEGQTRTGQGLQSAVMGGFGSMVARPLMNLAGKPLFGVTEQAKKLIDEGVFLTPGQAAKSKAIELSETAMEVMPFVARGTKQARERGQEEFAAKVLKKAVPESRAAKVTEEGTEGVAQVQKVLNKEYEKAWGTASELKPETFIRINQTASEGKRVLSKKDLRVVERVQDQIADILKRNPDVSAHRLDTLIRDSIPAKKSKIDLRNTLNTMRDDLRSGLSKKGRKRLAAADEAWPKFLTVRRAAKLARENRGKFTPKQLFNAVAAIGKDEVGAGRGPLQEWAELGAETVGRKISGQPLEWFRRVAPITPTPLPVQAMSNVALGRTAPQQALAKLLRSSPAYERLNRYINAPRIGAAYEE